MIALTIILLISTTLLGGIFFVLFRWAVRDGQFDDPEEAKYVIFREDEAGTKNKPQKH
ncbi:cbb3-type cytochrome oxidase assembly protein CcoS [Pontiella sp.]|uniref:cbb3-type cytochrome oxidase assembly protein CcoS n=1 Tax=Pontiella sp. TaxID=2837462 RepID=UPI0035687B53